VDSCTNAALEIEPNVSGPRLGLARIQRRRGQLVAAEREYRTVLGTIPESQEALTGLGLILLARQRPSEAVPYLVRSLEVGTKATGRRDVPSEMDTTTSFEGASLETPANREALDGRTRAARALGAYPDASPSICASTWVHAEIPQEGQGRPERQYGRPPFLRIGRPESGSVPPERRNSSHPTGDEAAARPSSRRRGA
jgi:hypothetical protein